MFESTSREETSKSANTESEILMALFVDVFASFSDREHPQSVCF